MPRHGPRYVPDEHGEPEPMGDTLEDELRWSRSRNEDERWIVRRVQCMNLHCVQTLSARFLGQDHSVGGRKLWR